MSAVPVPFQKRKRRLWLFVALICIVGVLIGTGKLWLDHRKRAVLVGLELKLDKARHPIQPELDTSRGHQFEFVLSPQADNRLSEYDNPRRMRSSSKHNE